jgi:2-methylfumaryl-CoA hydratase
MTVEESDHMTATRLYQNTAKVHFNQHAAKDGRFGRRIVYGGHVISLARCLSFNGLANAFRIVAINGGRHVAPIFAGDTVYAWSEVLAREELPGRSDLGALRLRLVAVKDQSCEAFPLRLDERNYDPAVVLDFDYTVLMPRRAAVRPGL